MEKITRKELEALTAKLNKILGRPENDAPGHLFVDRYNGYALRERTKGTGEAYFWPYHERVSARELAAYLESALQTAANTRCACAEPRPIPFGSFDPPAIVCAK